MRKNNHRVFNDSIALICEGTHTEPNFFGAMIDWLKEKGKITFEVNILPKPTINSDDNDLDLRRGTLPRKKRIPKNDTAEQQKLSDVDRFPGKPPLNWVNAGIEQLDTHNEVWVIFDKDGHPETENAFKIARQAKKEEKAIYIAFSSRCFEYYLLLHFELIEKSFEKSECNGKKYKDGRKTSKTISYHCMTPRAVEGKACKGDKCINGYARLRKYWENSKGNSSMFPLLRDKLWIGICNAHSIRWRSNAAFPEKPFYTRNPYVDVDRLICRLLGYKTIEPKEDHIIQSKKDHYHMSRIEDSIKFTLKSNTTLIIPSSDILIYNKQTGEKHEAENRIYLNPEYPEQTLNLRDMLKKDEYCIISESYFCTLLPS